MYRKIPVEINPSETSSKLTYANSFDSEFSLLLRERISVTLLNMQEAALEFESNMLEQISLKHDQNTLIKIKRVRNKYHQILRVSHQTNWMK